MVLQVNVVCPEQFEEFLYRLIVVLSKALAVFDKGHSVVLKPERVYPAVSRSYIFWKHTAIFPEKYATTTFISFQTFMESVKGEQLENLFSGQWKKPGQSEYELFVIYFLGEEIISF